MRILIAEDHPDIGLLMTKLVIHAGHEPSLAADGYEAVRLAAEVSPQLVLLDINMPGIDGYETARRLRERFDNHFPIFALTASPVNLPLAERSGFDGILSKPFDQDQLSYLIDQIS